MGQTCCTDNKHLEFEAKKYEDDIKSRDIVLTDPNKEISSPLEEDTPTQRLHKLESGLSSVSLTRFSEKEENS